MKNILFSFYIFFFRNTLFFILFLIKPSERAFSLEEEINKNLIIEEKKEVINEDITYKKKIYKDFKTGLYIAVGTQDSSFKILASTEKEALNFAKVKNGIYAYIAQNKGVSFLVIIFYCDYKIWRQKGLIKEKDLETNFKAIKKVTLNVDGIYKEFNLQAELLYLIGEMAQWTVTDYKNPSRLGTRMAKFLLYLGNSANLTIAFIGDKGKFNKTLTSGEKNNLKKIAISVSKIFLQSLAKLFIISRRRSLCFHN